MLHAVDRGTARTDELQDRLTQVPLGTAESQRRIEDKLDAIPTEAPTVVVTSVPGPIGATGPAGAAGATGATGATGAAGPVRTITVTVPPSSPPQADRSVPRPRLARATPAPTVTVTAEPVCVAWLAGLCVTR